MHEKRRNIEGVQIVLSEETRARVQYGANRAKDCRRHFVDRGHSAEELSQRCWSRRGGHRRAHEGWNRRLIVVNDD